MNLLDIIKQSANELGITSQQYAERDKHLAIQEEEQRKRAMNPNVSKGMSEDEKMKALNATKWRRFKETGIGTVPGSWN